jgi:hypothetical protein
MLQAIHQGIQKVPMNERKLLWSPTLVSDVVATTMVLEPYEGFQVRTF